MAPRASPWKITRISYMSSFFGPHGQSPRNPISRFSEDHYRAIADITQQRPINPYSRHFPHSPSPRVRHYSRNYIISPGKEVGFENLQRKTKILSSQELESLLSSSKMWYFSLLGIKGGIWRGLFWDLFAIVHDNHSLPKRWIVL